ncbi:hypothetical protein GCM10008023_27000 [Sphingomonas glacialis]|uniref:Major facilitator superfamily (MFS) profile domain-containing protein n=1 Tax=Sphingomonas glacialis TaxID=658225 RepID=A0ABQ3LP21_9SPHN|nr:hypothetical protein GCM10008023_27000 [Sphingomonas glacialis]
MFAIAGSPIVVLGARFADRIGKGLRGAPRDALVADVTPPEIRGKAFGLRQSLDTIGAFLGPLLAIGLMIVFTNNIRSVFWFAIIPAAIAVLFVIFGVEDQGTAPDATERARPPVRWRDLERLPRSFWEVTIIGVVFTLARFSEAFLILKANAEGLPIALAPLVLVAMNAVYALGAYPAGRLSDRVPAHVLFNWGLIVLILADLSLGMMPGLLGAFVGIALWGAHMALTQGLLAKLVADHAPADLRGSAFGVFNLATGVSMLFASVIAGVVWEYLGAGVTFLAGAGFSVVALFLVQSQRRKTLVKRLNG